ncbi:hypothetical protein [Pseudohalioglobus lutimaris]|uniref:Uncharacterized protein n=1 Tax=Pseudohalioglobus lutimaris TaxID=1737061 RepID=A0A2N5X4Y6_9GAMM|nr:hypothetical protein [Pseudohalioglobus lutimaris]PLW69557.1 hypothetical protein C0039_05965 [Pseudohalioglobus lutimaris]
MAVEVEAGLKIAHTQFAGILLCCMILTSILHGISPTFPAWIAGLFGWSAGLLLVSDVRGIPRIQAVIMLVLGSLGLLYGAYTQGEADYLKAVAANQALLSMLAAVSFLKLITLTATNKVDILPTGKRAMWRTLLGVHLFGAVINLSAIMIVGDRQSRHSPLSPAQATVLSRGFAMAANWSPFFAAMGVALTNAPGAELSVISPVGLPIAMIALAWSGWQLTRQFDVDNYEGYPLHFGSLWIPGLLAIAVLLTHHNFPSLPILTLISLLSVSLTLLVMTMRKEQSSRARIVDFVTYDLPGLRGELMLFLSAGVFAAGISSVIRATGFDLVPDSFGASEASLLLLVMTLLSILGIHPVISIVTASGLILPASPDMNLLAMTFLMTWSIGVCVSPLSGLSLAIQGRYNINSFNFLNWNGMFALLLLGLDILVLHLMEWY